MSMTIGSTGQVFSKQVRDEVNISHDYYFLTAAMQSVPGLRLPESVVCQVLPEAGSGVKFTDLKLNKETFPLWTKQDYALRNCSELIFYDPIEQITHFQWSNNFTKN
eukprot:TRINITY_DN2627_c0_g1_i2.p2 TRINITY_DN2627_c0_g1~~TRINITY_DN2627_c0_g1_i2.p2  ORF type:complete len:107 (+),score=29.03 TRINITY_DN2627_c0_g1_i2:399-719(+)